LIRWATALRIPRRSSASTPSPALITPTTSSPRRRATTLNGNTTHAANGNSYTYDSENHMITMSNGSAVVNLIYDAFGNRVAKTVNGATTQYLVEDDVNPTGLPAGRWRS
jgi:YD repeat-containing protein